MIPSIRISKHYFLIYIILLSLSISKITAQDNENLFEYWKYYSDAENTLYKHVSEIAFEQLNNRKYQIYTLQTQSDINGHQMKVRVKLDNIIGKFPRKTPLNAKVTGKLKGDGFTVEKVLFESQPGFYVTSALFIPEGISGRLPAVIYCSGHTWEGFRSITYQHVILNLVKKGFVVFAFDPIGQGERFQYLDEGNEKSIFSSPTQEHSFVGAQCFITGSSMAKYMIWDGIRCVDYLISRKEVDPERIGITGRSGGGTQSSYIAAFDYRIKAVAPENYITSFERILKSIGPQDAEQNFPGGIVNGIDHADLLEVRAPKPALIISTYNDFFSFQGVMDTYIEVKDYYTKAGAPDAVNMVVDEGGHQSTKMNREALYAFFQEHLNLPGKYSDIEVTPFEPEQLNVTKTGQIQADLKGETVFSLNKKEAKQKAAAIRDNRNNDTNDSQVVIKNAKRLSGYLTPVKIPEIIHSGREVTDSTIVTRYLVKGSGEYYLPILHISPITKKDRNPILYLDAMGKHHALSENSYVSDLIDSGYPVILADLRGIGELGPGYLTGDAYIRKISYNQWFAGILTGKSIMGLRSKDIITVRNSLRQLPETKDKKVTVIADGFITTDLIHASGFEKGFDKIVLINPLISWEMLVTNEHYDPKFIPSAISGALTKYDIPDVMATLAPGKVFMINPVDHSGSSLENPSNHPDIKYLNGVWKKAGSSGNFKIINSREIHIVDILNK
ncbi:alpha/beta hydrolase [Bacteroidota bacterium]